MAKYVLTDIELEEAISEIVTGKKIFHYNNEVMGMRYPTSKDRDNSRTIYVMKYKELEAQGLPKKEELKISNSTFKPTSNLFANKKKFF